MFTPPSYLKKPSRLYSVVAGPGRSSLTNRYLDPVEYVRKVLKLEPIPVVQEILRSLLLQPFKTMVKSGHSVGKTCAAAMAINWFFDTFDPGVVISTAPTAESVKNVLWKEVRMQRIRAGLPDVFIGPSAPEMRTSPDHYAQGLTARTGDALQGRHDLKMFLVMDEAVGIAAIFWQTFSSMFKPELGHAWLAIMNPTDTACEAYLQESNMDADKRKQWRTFTLSSLEHPNIVRQLAGLPALIPAAVTTSQVDEWIAQWCDVIDPEVEEIQKSDLNWPPGSQYWFRPGSLFQSRVQGLWPSMGNTGVWSELLWEKICKKRLPIPMDMLPEIGCDVATFGTDYTSIVVRWGPCALVHIEANGWDHYKTADKLMELARHWANEANKRLQPQVKRHDPKQIKIKVDDDGPGGGVVSILSRHGFRAVGVGAGESPGRVGWYPNKRSELWFETRDRAWTNTLDLTRLAPASLQMLKKQAMVVEWKVNQAGQRLVEPKEFTKKKCGRSPDSMDALNLAFYTGGTFEPVPILDEPPKKTLHERVFGHRKKEVPRRQNGH